MEWSFIMLLMSFTAGWYWFRTVQKHRDNIKGVPRGSLGWPIIGETLEFISSGYSSEPVRFMEKRKSLYGKVFKTNILGKPIIMSTDAEMNKVILQNQGNIFVPAYPKSTMELFGEHSIFKLDGHLQKKVHGIVGRYLRSSQFKARITRDVERSIKLNLQSWKDMDVVHVQSETRKVTFDVLVKALISVGPGDELELLRKDFAEYVKAILCLPLKFPGTRLYKSLKAKERLLEIVGKIVVVRKMAKERSEAFKSEGESCNDAVDALLLDKDENGDPSVPLEFISGNIVEMMIPGEETVPTAMTIAVKLLSDNPSVQKRLTEENMELKALKNSSGDEYTWADYISLIYTQNVISETLRLANIINGVWRKTLKDVEIGGYSFPKGWGVMAAFLSVHMDEQNYENPYKFDPSRWEKAGTVGNNCFTPFGGGQRLCPGMDLSRLEIAIFLHHLVTSYIWTAEEDTIIYFPTVKMVRKMPIRVAPIVV